MLEISYPVGMGFCHDGDDGGKIRKAGESNRVTIEGISKELLVTSGNNRQTGRKEPAVDTCRKWITVIGSSNYGGRI